jgi:hypothetical protein
VDKAEIDRLKRAIAHDRKGSTRPGVAFNKDLRDQIVTHAQTRLSAGERVLGIAESLGMQGDTLRYWLAGLGAERAGKTSQFRRVRVVKAEPGAEAGLTLFGPGGTRIDGLSLAQAAELLRRMS